MSAAKYLKRKPPFMMAAERRAVVDLRTLDEWLDRDVGNEVIAGLVPGLLVPTFRVLLNCAEDAYPFFSRESLDCARHAAAEAIRTGAL